MRAGGNALVAVCAALVVICAGTAYGASAAINADATVTVKEVFSLALDLSSVDFGSVRQGEWKEITGPDGYANAAICRSNTGRPWTLSIIATGPLMADSSTIPLENLKWMTTYAGSKNSPYDDYSSGLVYPPTGGFVDFSMVNKVIFSSASASIPNHNTLPSGAEIQFKYAVFIPDGITVPPGDYTTTVVYTLTE